MKLSSMKLSTGCFVLAAVSFFVAAVANASLPWVFVPFGFLATGIIMSMPGINR